MIVHLDIKSSCSPSPKNLSFDGKSSFKLSQPRKDLDIVHRSHDESELKIYFEKTSKQEEKVRIFTIPSKLLAVHLFDTMEVVDGKQPLQFQHSYNKEMDILLVRFVPNESIKPNSIKTFAALEDDLLIESDGFGIIGFEVIGAKYLIEIK